MALHGREKVGVLFVNTGTPSAPEPKAVKRYLAQFLMDKHIAPMNRFICGSSSIWPSCRSEASRRLRSTERSGPQRARRCL